MKIDAYSVSYINNYLKEVIDSDSFLKKITLKGEISNLSWRGGHAYFSLKDADSSLRAIIFAGAKRNIIYDPHNGDEVILFGDIELYVPNGTYQIIVKDIMLAGEGERLINLEKLRAQLQAEGLFNADHKKQIPPFPRCIGVITAREGAAIHDIYVNIIKRFPLCKIHLFASSVQGKNAPSELLRALNMAIDDKVDTIIMGRGGGDSDDLSAFNDELLVRAIYACPIPFISAVGHESDTTLVDYVADLRASTPTEAAVQATPNYNDLMLRIAGCFQQLDNVMGQAIINRSIALNTHLRLIKGKYPLKEMTSQQNMIRQMDINMKRQVERTFEEHQRQISQYATRIDQIIMQRLQKYSVDLDNRLNILTTINPHHILERGYAIPIDEEGKLITSIAQIKTNTQMKTILKDGKIISNILRKEEK